MTDNLNGYTETPAGETPPSNELTKKQMVSGGLNGYTETPADQPAPGGAPVQKSLADQLGKADIPDAKQINAKHEEEVAKVMAQIPGALSGNADPAVVERSWIGNTLHQIGNTVKDSWGTTDLGMPKDKQDELNGFLDKMGTDGPIRAAAREYTNQFLIPGIVIADATLRTLKSTVMGYAATAYALGVPRDIIGASIGEASGGSPAAVSGGVRAATTGGRTLIKAAEKVGVTAEHFKDPEKLVEADIKLHSHESALGERPQNGVDVATTYDPDSDPAGAHFAAAKQLGVLGPDKKVLEQRIPEMQAARKDDILQSGRHDPYNKEGRPNIDVIPLEHEATLAKTKTFIDDATPPAPPRTGTLSVAQKEDLAHAMGMNPEQLSATNIEKTLPTDAHVDTAITAIWDATERAHSAMVAAQASGRVEDFIKAEDELARHQLVSSAITGDHDAEERLMALLGMPKENNPYPNLNRSGNEANLNRNGNPRNLVQPPKPPPTPPAGSTGGGKKGGGGGGTAAGGGAPPPIPNPNTGFLAQMAAVTTPQQFAHVLANAAKVGWPTDWKFYLYNAILSGGWSHAGYAIGGTALWGWDTAVIAPISGAVGLAHQSAADLKSFIMGTAHTQVERTYMIESLARLAGTMEAMPRTIQATWAAVKSGIPTPLPVNVVQQGVSAYSKHPPPGGAFNTAVSIPGRGIAGIHTFFNFVGANAEAEAIATRRTLDQGIQWWSPQFKNVKAQWRATPTAADETAVVTAGERSTYTAPLESTFGKRAQGLADTHVGALTMPFMRVPSNAVKIANEGNLLMTIMSPRMRKALMGKDGAARDTQIARLAAGSGIAAMTAYWGLNDRITGAGPDTYQDQLKWKQEGKIPFAIRLGDKWHSYARLGAVGGMLAQGAMIAEAYKKYEAHTTKGEMAEALGSAAWSASEYVGHYIGEAGFKGLAQLIDAFDAGFKDGGNSWGKYLAARAQPISALSQYALANDPYIRRTMTPFDAFKARLPGASGRQSLEPVYDWLGTKVRNPHYGEHALGAFGVEGPVFPANPVQHDPIRLEALHLDINPAGPKHELNGIKMTREQYETYAQHAGALVRKSLQDTINQPGYYDQPLPLRQLQFNGAIASGRALAGSGVKIDGMGTDNDIINQGIENHVAPWRDNTLKKKR